MIGSILGVLIDRGVLFHADVAAGFCVTKPNPMITNGQAFAVEMFATLVLLFTIFATCDKARRQSGSGALAIGLAVALSHFAFVSPAALFLAC